MANSYTTLALIAADIPESAYGTTSSTDYDTAIEGFIAVASRLVDLELGKFPGFFYPTTDSVTMYYDGSGEHWQDIDEFVSISSVAVSESGGVSSSDYTTYSSSDYFLEPHNYATLGKPITRIVLDRLNGSQYVFYGYKKSVQVVGIPGYSLTVPEPIAQAVKMQTIRWLQRAKQFYQDVGAQVEIGGLTVKGQQQLDPDIKALLWPYKLEFSI